MLRSRVIPNLMIHNSGLYKTTKFNLRKAQYIGDPINAIKIFNDKMVDEIIILDVDASKKNRDPDWNALSELSSECFMPAAYGGGIRSIIDIKRLFEVGFEKAILNTILIDNSNIVKDAVEIFGSQSIVASIDIKKNLFGKYEVFNSSIGKRTNLNPLDFIVDLAEMGIGELFITFVDLEGSMKGYDIDFLRQVTSLLDIPVVVNGGAGNLKHFQDAINLGGASAVSAGSMFVFSGPHKAVLITYPDYDELEAILS